MAEDDFFYRIKAFLIVLLAVFSLATASEKICIKKFQVKGAHSISQEEIQRILTPYEGKCYSLSELKKITSKITQLYIQKGFITSRAYIPPQQVKDGVLIIDVIEGKVGNINISGEFKYYSKGFVESYFSGYEGKVLNKNSLEKTLLVLNSYMDLSVNANLKKGTEVGTSDIDITVESKKYPFKGAVFYDNYGSEYTSRNRYGINLSGGNLLKEGSVFSVTGIIGDSYNKLHTGSASYQLPVGTSGLIAGALISAGNSNIGKELAILNIKSYSEYYSIFLRYPLIKTTVKEVYLKGSVNATNYKQSILGETTARDKYRYIDVGIGYTRTGYKKRFAAEFNVVQGLGEILDSFLGTSSYTTRAAAEKGFTKYTLDVVYNQVPVDRLMVIFRFKGQYSPDILLSSQNFYIGGPASIRGFLLTQYGGDSGYAVTAEGRIMPLEDMEKLQLAVFLDTGQVFLNSTAIGQSKNKTLTGGGFGVRARLPWDINLTADLAFPIEPEMDGTDREYNFYCQIVKSF
ncbi:ShlB/FhaC/HecB family hemolysin secretion/activation protein [Persephonella sp.]